LYWYWQLKTNGRKYTKTLKKHSEVRGRLVSVCYRVCTDYALITTSSYVDVQVGINDRRVFDVPAQCRHAGRPRMMSIHDAPPASELDFYD